MQPCYKNTPDMHRYLKFTPSTVKRLIRRTLRNHGWELSPFSLERSEWAQVKKMLDFKGVMTVLDVGANSGQYAKNIRDAGFGGKIISVEPGSEAHGSLTRAAAGDPLWHILPPMALGKEDGFVELHVSANHGESSSILPILAASTDAMPESGYIATERVALATLDTVAKQYLNDGDCPVFLKLDVQGFESEVLKGATQLLPTIVGLQVELSLVPLYQGQLLFNDMINLLRGHGFELWSLIPGFLNPATGRLLQVDGLFLRSQEAVGARNGDSPTLSEPYLNVPERSR